MNPLTKLFRQTRVSPDKHVDAVVKQMLERSYVGLRKYGVTTERTDLDIVDWLRHAQQESMDHAIYLEVLIQKFSATSPANTERSKHAAGNSDEVATQIDGDEA